MDRLRLANKIAIVTGAGSGIGKATALLFAREGAQVIAGIYEAGHAPALVEESVGLAGSILPVRADVSRDEDAGKLTKAAMESFGGLDILFNNAGIEHAGLITETTEEVWNQLLDVNLKSMFLCAKHAVPEMLRRGKGAIVNNSSINGIRGNHRLAAYSASKGGVVALTLALALDYAPHNIRVNCICPATIDTPMLDASLKLVPDPAAQLKELVAKHPMGRLGRPDEVAYTVLFLASDEASFITGTVLAIDGGRSIR